MFFELVYSIQIDLDKILSLFYKWAKLGSSRLINEKTYSIMLFYIYQNYTSYYNLDYKLMLMLDLLIYIMFTQLELDYLSSTRALVRLNMLSLNISRIDIVCHPR